MTDQVTRDDFRALRLEVKDAINALRVDITALEAKIDSKPSLGQMYMSVVLTLFGLLALTAATVITLNALGFIRAH